MLNRSKSDYINAKKKSHKTNFVEEVHSIKVATHIDTQLHSIMKIFTLYHFRPFSFVLFSIDRYSLIRRFYCTWKNWLLSIIFCAINCDFPNEKCKTQNRGLYRTEKTPFAIKKNRTQKSICHRNQLIESFYEKLRHNNCSVLDASNVLLRA